MPDLIDEIKRLIVKETLPLSPEQAKEVVGEVIEELEIFADGIKE